MGMLGLKNTDEVLRETPSYDETADQIIAAMRPSTDAIEELVRQKNMEVLRSKSSPSPSSSPSGSLLEVDNTEHRAQTQTQTKSENKYATFEELPSMHPTDGLDKNLVNPLVDPKPFPSTYYTSFDQKKQRFFRFS